MTAMTIPLARETRKNGAVAYSSGNGRLQKLIQKAQGFIAETKAPNTLRSYESDWRSFCSWSVELGFEPLPADPQAVSLYLTDIAERLRFSSIKRQAAAIHHYHLLHGMESPCQTKAVTDVLAGIRRSLGCKTEGKAPLLPEHLRGMVKAMPATISGIRDRCILLFGFSGGFRRSEIVGMDVADLEFTAEGIVATIRRSKTDQDGESRQVGIPKSENAEMCPVEALGAWLRASGIGSGPVFRPINRHGHIQNQRLSGEGVSLVVKRAVESVGLDPSEFGGHSLRIGFCTAAALAGVEERLIMKQTGHQSVGVVRGYIRDASLFRQNAAKAIAL